jgi:excisionase family DNA binding protein
MAPPASPYADEELLSPKEAAAELGISLKAVQRLIARERFPNVQREVSAGGKVTRVRIPRSDVAAYVPQRGKPASGRAAPSSPRRTSKASSARESVWQQVAEEQAQEILRLKVRVRELEAKLEAQR